MRAGKDYDSHFSKRMHEEGVWADLVRQRFVKAVERLGMNATSGRFAQLDASRFKRLRVVPTAPVKQCGSGTRQLDFFG
ncbi:radical SAM domain protein [Massilia aquatica]|uniref:radical SAM domain protein n=1 Tax=Massilia aquatica TaxID=2609000 RepID=UPI001651E65D|nr:radical SAM domain protein [Massilia aquatica]